MEISKTKSSVQLRCIDALDIKWLAGYSTRKMDTLDGRFAHCPQYEFLTSLRKNHRRNSSLRLLKTSSVGFSDMPKCTIYCHQDTALEITTTINQIRIRMFCYFVDFVCYSAVIN
ncbi:hypothetical protein OESDEN_00720 [Oesophagostomum dentatum]|uniref:Uncharacterized protein n=1 Tax=Oesophagostomum dentatum TaxID=61180 RepID=A0A0B1TV23_OESDE|nr:hypothetical protein OESDEN_00720 [Oesophagostomum dentatum]